MGPVFWSEINVEKLNGTIVCQSRLMWGGYDWIVDSCGAYGGDAVRLLERSRRYLRGERRRSSSMGERERRRRGGEGERELKMRLVNMITIIQLYAST